MAIRAKLLIDEKEFNILFFSFNFHQGSDVTGRPTQRPVFKGIQITLETQKDANFYEWMIQKNLTKNFEIHITPRVLGTRTRKIKFYDTHLVYWKNNFSATDEDPVSETLTINAGGVEDSFSSGVYSTKWRVSFDEETTEATSITEYVPRLLEYHLEDLQNNKITKEEVAINEEFYIVIKSEHSEGRTMSIDLQDGAKDYEYNGVYMKNDIISNIPINGDITKVKIKAVEEREDATEQEQELQQENV